ncbi:hypothetical protein GQ53DRAFT_17317 [Thozetella sp. PMI_491]|nr:hypothetical protein GQ53DRAFT_17317 [Thozetella sp. PMI_491]
MTMMSANTSIDSTGGVDFESSHQRKELPMESKMRFLDLVDRLKRYSVSSSRISPGVMSHCISGSSVGSEDTAKVVAHVPTHEDERECKKPQGKKLDPTAAEFRAVGSFLGSPISYFPKRLSRPALSNVFPEAAHLGQGHQTLLEHREVGNAIHGAIGGPICGGSVSHPYSSFNETGLGFPSRSSGRSPVIPAVSSQEIGSYTHRFNTVPATNLFMERHDTYPTSHYSGTTGIGSNPPLLSMNGVGTTYPFSGPPLNPLPQQAPGGNFASNHQGLHGMPDLTSMQLSMPPIPPTIGYNSLTTGQHNAMAASFAGSIQPGHTTSQGTSDRPLFPVTRKPRGNNPWQQMEYERFLEWRKANEPGYHMSCKMRQAQRVIRQHHQQQGTAA